MMQILIINELNKVLKRKRTYISFLLIGILIPFIVGAISNGGTTLEKSIYGQFSDSFFFIGSLLNGYLATYIIIAVLINHMPFCLPSSLQIFFLVNIPDLLLECI